MYIIPNLFTLLRSPCYDPRRYRQAGKGSRARRFRRPWRRLAGRRYRWIDEEHVYRGISRYRWICLLHRFLWYRARPLAKWLIGY